jgi:integrase
MFEIDFYSNGQRKTIPLGAKYTEQTATELKRTVETLLHCKANSVAILDKRTTVWIESASQEIKEKLARVGLIELAPSHTLKDLWDAFLESKAGELKAGKIKEATRNLYGFIGKRFFLFFDSNESLNDLTKDRMQQWKDYLLDEVAEATVACYIKETKACFNWAVSKGWIAKSPLDGVSPGSFVNKKNVRMIPMGAYYRLLDACPCQDWRVIIALVRIGGLRCPSEVLQLRWEDVNWEHNKFYVRSPKTEQHEGKEGRWVPLFPELKQELETLFLSPLSKRKEFVINRYRDASQNLRTTFEKIVKRAGLEVFPSPFRNLRMTRSNEVYRKYGAFKESQWIGHSGRIRADHYLMLTDDDFQEASQWAVQGKSVGSQRETNRQKSGKKTADTGFPAFLPAVQGGNASFGIEGIKKAD